MVDTVPGHFTHNSLVLLGATFLLLVYTILLSSERDKCVTDIVKNVNVLK